MATSWKQQTLLKLSGLDLSCADKGRVLASARAEGLAAEGDVVLACGMRF